jgi:hypothetical protein
VNWISVKDEMPDNDRYVLIAVKRCDYETGAYHYEAFLATYVSEHHEDAMFHDMINVWYVKNTGSEYGDPLYFGKSVVEYWMNVPELPKVLNL